jgi:hypothetical protein
VKKQFQHKQGKASDAMRESNGTRTKAGKARKSNVAVASRAIQDATPPSGLAPGEIETLSGLVTSAMSSLTAMRTILGRRRVKEQQSK